METKNSFARLHETDARAGWGGLSINSSGNPNKGRACEFFRTGASEHTSMQTALIESY